MALIEDRHAHKIKAHVWFEFEGYSWRVVERPGYTAIYRRFGKGPFRDQLEWSSRQAKPPRFKPPGVGTILARVLSHWDRTK